MNRKEFLTAVGGIALFSIVPSRVLGGGKHIAPSDQLTKGLIGCGAAGRSPMHFANSEACRLTALCDVNENRLNEAKSQAQSQLRQKVKTYHNYRDLLRDPNVDIVDIATPPHWHGIMAAEAAYAGKDVWCETPMTRTIGEGKKVSEAMRQNKRIFGLNTWFRYSDTFYGLGTTVAPLKKIADSGVLGWPLKIRISAPTGFDWDFSWVGKETLLPHPIPKELDYDLWLGPAPYKPYNEDRVKMFRGYWDYSGGCLAEMGQHYLDPVQYILGKDNASPVLVDIDAPQQHPDAVGTWRTIKYIYGDGCQIILESDNGDNSDVPFIEGPRGKIFKGFRCTIPDVANVVNNYPNPEAQNTDFFDCVRTRKKFAVNEECGFRSATIINMGIAALRLGHSLRFDPTALRFIDDDAANKMIDQPMRGSWKI